MKNYLRFNRDEWASFSSNDAVRITKDELAKIKSLGDVINLTDVQEIYGSLINYLYLVYQEKRTLQQKQSEFLKQHVLAAPFIIGISGSVAVGKSTTARLLQVLLSRTFPSLNVHLMTTDGFIYPNEELKRRGLFDRKGFPESYNMNLLSDFLKDVLSGKENIAYPLYSQELSDIVPGKYGHVKQPDILIIEGINTLQLPTNGQIVTSDFFDFSIYIDADEELIEKWFMQRFERVLEMNKNDPTNFYYEMANGPRADAIQLAQDTWQMVNLVNLREYIAPTKQRASLILHKTTGHKIDEIYLRQF
ncbi:type I pantothenate kinase [Lactobacillus sp. M0403]|uniref:type I pantothenate kinase n=1 Tax=Lactobacillus TaxID=1578 RepID=UPI00164FBBBD|nr:MULTISPECIES: type I pantothenate kinase [Lactobacillus]MBC6361814.1 type I pantothenate kinase [Lactobacillus apis]MBI0093400.1 type I pantothenate kinase [Lactobacillus sp. M0403]MCT6821947.1 type I pantothenate kinase [Lactobacillus apis]MCT6877602.1 type I pantothenate kinase [Lactobacillus apis]